MRFPRWTPLAALPAVLALAACQSQPAGCPGRVIASLALHGTLDVTATGCATPPAAGWTAPATLPDGSPDATFRAVFTWDDAGQQLAYCSGGPHAAVLYGTRDGDHVHAEITLPGAALGACAATCAPLMTVVIDGDLSPAGSPPAFSGTLTETYDQSQLPCEPCVLPCTSTYAVTGTGT